ncbi:MAG: hypothetical protein NT142_16050, partial [Planctomycetota bacterium]|nr:hypothetical protein [Planctomycetota bacterium]
FIAWPFKCKGNKPNSFMDFLFIISIFCWLHFENSLSLINFLKYNIASKYIEHLNVIPFFWLFLILGKGTIGNKGMQRNRYTLMVKVQSIIKIGFGGEIGACDDVMVLHLCLDP